MSPIVGIFARVDLRSSIDRQAVCAYWEAHRERFDGPDWLLDLLLTDADADYLELAVTLSAETSTGRHVDANSSFGLAGPLRNLGAIWHQYRGPHSSDDPRGEKDLLERTYRVGPLDIEDGINEMLGRGTDLHRPPVLAWGSLIDVLTAEGIPATEQQLIGTPLTVEFAADVLTAIDHQ